MNFSDVLNWLNSPAGVAVAAALVLVLPKVFPVIGPYLAHVLAAIAAKPDPAPVPLTPATPATPATSHPLLDLLLKLIAQRAAAQGIKADDALDKFVLGQLAEQTGVTVDAAPADHK